MRRFAVAISLLSLVILSCFLLQHTLSASTERVLAAKAPLEEALLAENRAESARLAEEFLALWEEEKDWMYFVLIHNYIDEAEESGENLRHAIHVEDYSAALSELTNIAHTLIYLSQKDILTLKNLF